MARDCPEQFLSSLLEEDVRVGQLAVIARARVAEAMAELGVVTRLQRAIHDLVDLYEGGKPRHTCGVCGAKRAAGSANRCRPCYLRGAQQRRGEEVQMLLEGKKLPRRVK